MAAKKKKISFEMEDCGQVKKILNNREKRKLTSSGNGLISSSRSRATRATSPRAAASRNFSAIPATHLQKKRKWTIIRGIRFKLHPYFSCNQCRWSRQICRRSGISFEKRDRRIGKRSRFFPTSYRIDPYRHILSI